MNLQYFESHLKCAIFHPSFRHEKYSFHARIKIEISLDENSHT